MWGSFFRIERLFSSVLIFFFLSVLFPLFTFKKNCDGIWYLKKIRKPKFFFLQFLGVVYLILLTCLYISTYSNLINFILLQVILHKLSSIFEKALIIFLKLRYRISGLFLFWIKYFLLRNSFRKCTQQEY